MKTILRQRWRACKGILFFFAFDASAFTLEFAKHEISRYMAKPAQAIVDAVESGTDLLERIHASSVSTLHDSNCCITCIWS